MSLTLALKKIPLFLSTLMPLSYYGSKNKWISGAVVTNGLSAPPMKPSKLWDNSAFPVKVLPDLPLSLGLIGHGLVSCDMELIRRFAEGAAAHARDTRPYCSPSHSTASRPPEPAGSPPKGSLLESKLKWLLPDNGGPVWWKKGALGYARAFFYMGISWPRENELFL